MKKQIPLILFLTLSLLAAHTPAASPPPTSPPSPEPATTATHPFLSSTQLAAGRAQIIAPFVFPHTDLVLHLNLESANPATVAAWYAVSIGDSDHAEQLASLLVWISEMRMAGAQDVYLVARLSDPQFGPQTDGPSVAVVVPLASDSDVPGVLRLVNQIGTAITHLNTAATLPSFVVQKIGACAVMTMAHEIASAQTTQPAHQDELRDALRENGAAACQIIILPTSQGAVSLPLLLGGGADVAPLIRLVSIGLNLPPAPTAHLSIQSQNPAAADQTAAALKPVITLLEQALNLPNEITLAQSGPQVFVDLPENTMNQIVKSLLNKSKPAPPATQTTTQKSPATTP